MGIEELQAVQIELDGRPGMGLQQVGEIVDQLCLREMVQLMIEIGADASDGSGVGLDGFRLQALQA